LCVRARPGRRGPAVLPPLCVHERHSVNSPRAYAA